MPGRLVGVSEANQHGPAGASDLAGVTTSDRDLLRARAVVFALARALERDSALTLAREIVGDTARSISDSRSARSSRNLDTIDHYTDGAIFYAGHAGDLARRFAHTIDLAERARDIAADIVRDFDHDLDTAHDIARARALDLTAALTRVLDRTHLSARDTACDIARVLDRAGSRMFGYNRALARAHHLASELRRQLTIAYSRNAGLDSDRIVAGGLASDFFDALASIPVDVSDTDVAELVMFDEEALNAVVWNAETVWSPEIAGRVRLRSREISPGVFQIGGGTEPNPAPAQSGPGWPAG